MPDFTQGLIYTIRTRNSIYVGSTTNFSDRKRSHKSAIYSETYYDLKLYKTIRDNDGEWYMEYYKEYPCENNIQLQIEEERVRCELNADLNMKSCGTGLNQAELGVKEYNKQYCEVYKDKIKEKQHEKYMKNRDKILKKNKQYAIDNKDKISEYNKQFRIDNKEKIRERENKKKKCECGCIVIKMARHKKSKKHLDCMEKINSD
jgi:hypothetical protein